MEERTIIIKNAGFGTFLRGAIIGAALALLLAPRSGRETREILTEKGLEFRDRADDLVQDTRIRAEMALSSARNKVDETVKGVKQGIQQGASEANKELKRELEISEDINNPYHNL